MLRFLTGLGIGAVIAISPPSPIGQPSFLPVCTRPSTHRMCNDGLASWYGEQFEGSETASGEPYDMNALTAAHRDLPLGTQIRVTNLRNHRSLVLRVNDRGPFVPGRLLDVSHAAARLLGFSGRGVARVRIQIVRLPRNLPYRLACPGSRLYAMN